MALILNTLDCPLHFSMPRIPFKNKKGVPVQGTSISNMVVTIKPGMSNIDAETLEQLQKKRVSGKPSAFSECLAAAKDGRGLFMNDKERIDEFNRKIIEERSGNPEAVKDFELKRLKEENEINKKELAELKKLVMEKHDNNSGGLQNTVS